ncbi:G1/S-specific cyclin-D1 isoform X11 [Drosophila ananassae]|uniref:G1/S-specific cyclin-D1 isoform X11 n=1 Tax=Drosophila ananassae TaxID=7217 RepID=UPI0013A5E4D1|nr:G1/S-specific cyclin-D1 isoform X11 [Drosophila ananassae]
MKKSLNSCSKNMTPSYVKGESTTTQGSVNTAVRDPILLSDRSLEIALRVERNRNQVDFYFSIQKDITPAMRKIVAEWMLEILMYQCTGVLRSSLGNLPAHHT